MPDTLQTSVNPLNNKKYTIPEHLSDRVGIDAFIQHHPGKKIVVVQGLGFVGAVMSLVVANALTEEYAVMGIDLPTPASWWKIQAINEGMFPVIADDPKIGQFYQRSREKNNFYASFDPYAYAMADTIVVDINLDVQKVSGEEGRLNDYSVDLAPFKKAIQSIGEYCRPDVLVLVETTVPPGTSMKIVKPMLEQSLAARGLPLDQLKVGHSYERVMPGPKYVDSIQNFYRVYSGVDERSADAAETFLRTIIRTDEYPLTRLGNTHATEMAKVLENSFRAMNIAFMVEWSRFAEEAGVNLYEVVNAIRMRPTHKNIMLPGLGVGGYCLTKDPLMASWAKQHLFGGTEGLPQSETGVRINDRMPYHAFDFLSRHFKVADMKDKRALLLGVSYLNDVGDTRYTPVRGIFEQLSQAGMDITLHDPHVVYWEEKTLPVTRDLGALLASPAYDLIVISTGHRDYRGNPGFIDQLLALPPTFVYDTIGVLTPAEIGALSAKHTVRVLGRGDL